MSGFRIMENVWGRTKGTTGRYGRSTWTVRAFYAPCFIQKLNFSAYIHDFFTTAQSRFLVSGSADNEMRLWSVQTGKCLYVWEFPTAVKRVAFNEDDDQIVCITEQRMGYQSTIRVFDINREGDGTNRTCATCYSMLTFPDAHRSCV